MDEQMKKNIAVIVIMLLSGYFFFTTPMQSFTCDRTKNVCTEKSTMPLIGKVQKEKTFKLSDIKSAYSEYKSRIKTSGSGHNKKRSREWSSRLILETTSGDVQIFNTYKGSNKAYQDEYIKIKQFLNSNEQTLNIEYNNTAIYVILALLFLVSGFALFRKSE